MRDMVHILTIFLVLGFIVFIVSLASHENVYAVQLKILESKLNKHSITGTLQNQYDYPIGGINVQAEFYDNNGKLVGVRDVGSTSKSELKPNEKSSYKIPDIGKQFPRTEFNVSAEGTDYTNMVDVSSNELIGQIRDLGRALKELPDEVVITVTTNQTDNSKTVNKSLIYHEDNGTNSTVNLTVPN
jgi:hypothetical protein